MKFRIDLKIFLLIFLFLITNQIKVYALIMAFAIVHELGHLVTGLILGMPPDKLEIKPLGVAIDFNIKRRDYMIKVKNGNLLEVKKIVVAMAGPLTNSFIIFILMTNIFEIDYYDKMLVIFSNIVLIIFNIFPIYPLDGGRILKGIIYILKGKYIAEKYTYYISYITLIIITVSSSIVILYLKNIAIFLAVIFLWVLEIREQSIYRKRKILYETIEKEMKKDEYKNIKIPIENNIN